jgi:hypothetical protein
MSYVSPTMITNYSHGGDFRHLTYPRSTIVRFADHASQQWTHAHPVGTHHRQKIL